MRLRSIVLTIVYLSGLFAVAAFGQTNDEARARALFAELRCVVCQNQSILDSDADVARDLREIVREQIAAGKSDAEIRDFLTTRYGEFILLKPAFAPHTWLLWLGPLLIFGVGGFLVIRMLQRSPAIREEAALNSEERARLDDILNKS